jgi:hypothetical protein
MERKIARARRGRITAAATAPATIAGVFGGFAAFASTDPEVGFVVSEPRGARVAEVAASALLTASVLLVVGVG